MGYGSDWDGYQICRSHPAVKYRTTDERVKCAADRCTLSNTAWLEMVGCPFALFGAIGTFGGGNMLQANSVADVMK